MRNNQSQKTAYLFKIVMVGDFNSGKTWLLTRYGTAKEPKNDMVVFMTDRSICCCFVWKKAYT